MTEKVTDQYPKKDEQLSKKVETKKSEYPTETVPLPSKGLLYPKSNPLSSGEVEMRYMTAKDEDILTSQNLIRQGTVLDKLMESLIVSDIEYDDILIGDKNAIMIAARILGYGKEYEASVTCPNCGTKNVKKFDLTQFNDKEINEELYTHGINEFDFELPNSKKLIKFKLLTGKEDKMIDQQLKNLKKFSSESGVNSLITTRLFYSIISVDGDSDKNNIRRFVEKEMLAIDSRALRKYINEITPDIDLRISFDCDECGYEDFEMSLPMDVSFFWPRV